MREEEAVADQSPSLLLALEASLPLECSESEEEEDDDLSSSDASSSSKDFSSSRDGGVWNEDKELETVEEASARGLGGRRRGESQDSSGGMSANTSSSLEPITFGDEEATGTGRRADNVDPGAEGTGGAEACGGLL